MKIGDIVCYIREDDEYDKKLGFYPPIGTLGRIVETCEDSIGVKWARGATKGDGIWFCDVDDIKLMPTVSGWIMSGIFDNFAKCPYCGQTNHPLNVAVEWKFCPYCGEKVNYDEEKK